MFYTIIGGDGNQYGPSSEADLRQWIAEGRINANTMARRDGENEFHPLSTFQEFASSFSSSQPAPIAPGAAPVTGSEDYDLAIGGCVKAGWNLVKNNFWATVGVTALIVVITGILNQIPQLFTRPIINDMMVAHHFTAKGILVVSVLSMAVTPIYTVFFAGLYMYFLKLIRGQGATVGDVFTGFGPSLWQLVLLGWVQGILTMIGLCFCIIPGLYLMISWLFAVPLVIERRLGFWDAMELSRKRTGKHWFLVFGFLIVYCLVALSGVIGCCIGIFVTIPIGIAMYMYGYETIFPSGQNF